MKKSQETKFYEALKNVFTGVPIEGEGGYVNLLKIKQKYYENVLQVFQSEVNSDPIVCGFKEDFFNYLYTFFDRYFSECGSIYFTKTASWQKVYEKIYTNEKDVVLFWKTNMLYYVKSDTLYQNTVLKIDYNGKGYVFKFDVNNLQQKQNNEKVGLKYTFNEFLATNTSLHDDNSKTGTYVIAVEIGNQTKTDDETLIKGTKLPEEVIQKAIDKFKKQTSVDYFINKNAKAFLEEQLDLFLNQILLDTSSQFDQNRLDQLKAVKEFALKLIAFISQFEDELVFIWNKPKFVRNSNYVISLDLISDIIKAKIRNHKGLPAQIQEWKELKLVDDSFSFQEMELLGNPYLPIDTKHFKDLELEIIGQFENLDDALNGRLIKSENYQALNTLQKRYKEQIQCVYIDPPFNTGSDFAYMDNYQDSTWLSLMSDRIALVKKLLNKKGNIYLQLDYRADFLGRELLDSTFDKENFLNELIWHYRTYQGQTNSYYPRKHDVIFWYAKNKDEKSNFTIGYTDNYQETVDYKRWKDFIVNGNEIRYPNYPKTDSRFDGYYKKYLNKVGTPKNGDIIMKINGYVLDSVWMDIQAIDPKDQKERIIYKDNLTQKPETLLKRLIETITEGNSLVFDFFGGSGTTMAVAHKMGRKYIGVELDEKFEDVIIPRMKRVLTGYDCGISNQVKWKGGGFFKYYQLEQYEDVLKRARYNINTIPYSDEVYDKYIFFADDKFADTISVNQSGINIDLSKLYEDIDLPETISLLLGKPIIKITENEVVLAGVQEPIKYNVNTMSDEEKKEFIQLVKPLLWWGKNN